MVGFSPQHVTDPVQLASIAFKACPDETPGAGPALDCDSAQVVVADQGGRADHNPHFYQAAQRDHLAFGISHINAVDAAVAP
jgi:hypothetical protein